MTGNVHARPVRPRGGGSRDLIRWIGTKNPFYVLSAGLFLAGLYISFGDPAEAEETWALMGGLAGYTLLLAVTGCLLVRFGNVWDDVRTVLLLVVLMFLATSVTFDQVLVIDPGRGRICYLGGLLLAIAVSEGILHGIRLVLPAWFRLPYYLILGLFFLYPVALRPLVDANQPHSEATMWGLFLFSAVAGLVFLTLLPAIHRGPMYVADNGSPWRWPLYPWVLFGLLALAVPARAFLLCWSMHPLALVDFNWTIFAPYFLAPFGLALAVLLVEIGLVSRARGVLWIGLAFPLGMVLLTLAGQRPDPIYQEFRGIFTRRLAGDPLFQTLLASAGFYIYAVIRRVPWAGETLTAALAALIVVGPRTLVSGNPVPPQMGPILIIALLQLGLGLWRWESWRCLLGYAALVALAALFLQQTTDVFYQGLIVFHLALLAMLTVGAVFDDAFAGALRFVGAGLLLMSCLAATFAERPQFLPWWATEAYPLVMAGVLALYGQLVGHGPALLFAVLIPLCWLGSAGVRGYLYLRQIVRGLDYLAVSLVLFARAVLISLGKSRVMTRRLSGPRARAPESLE